MYLITLLSWLNPIKEIKDGLPDIIDILEEIDHGEFDKALTDMLHLPGNKEKQVIELKIELAESLHKKIHDCVDPLWPEKPQKIRIPKFRLVVAMISMVAVFIISTGVVYG
jgi:hypothetical protein